MIIGYPTNMPTSKSLLLERYLQWQSEQGGRRSLREFAQYLEIHEVTLNRLMNKPIPASKQMLVHLAQKLNDPRFLDLENIPHPDPDLQTLSRLWPRLSEETRHTLREQAEKYVTENEPSPARSRAMEETS
jgi:hypothetical protein